MVSWSSDAPSTSTVCILASHSARAASRTDSTVASAGTSRSRLCLAWSTLISEVAIRIATVLSCEVSNLT